MNEFYKNGKNKCNTNNNNQTSPLNNFIINSMNMNNNSYGSSISARSSKVLEQNQHPQSKSLKQEFYSGVEI